MSFAAGRLASMAAAAAHCYSWKQQGRDDDDEAVDKISGKKLPRSLIECSKRTGAN
jgi:hypothetical protein